MKLYIKSNSNSGYLYIFKHGVGPGTIPKDVAFLREKDLPNGYTAVWLDRFLTADELKAYDIPSETEINYYLDRIGYCQKNGDVVPCDKVTANSSPLKLFKILDLSTKTVSDMNAESSRRALERFLECDVIPVSTREEADYVVYPYNQPEMDRYYIKKDNIESLMSPYADALTSIGYDGAKFLNTVRSECTYDELMQMDAVELHAYICGFILNSDYITQEDASKLADDVINKVNNINACDNITAYDHRTEYLANKVSASYGFDFEDSYDFIPLDEEDYAYVVIGYSDPRRTGIANIASTDDLSEANEKITEFANKGYFITLNCNKCGKVMEFNPDTWFEHWYPDGLTEDLFN